MLNYSNTAGSLKLQKNKDYTFRSRDSSHWYSTGTQKMNYIADSHRVRMNLNTVGIHKLSLKSSPAGSFDSALRHCTASMQAKCWNRAHTKMRPVDSHHCKQDSSRYCYITHILIVNLGRRDNWIRWDNRRWNKSNRMWLLSRQYSWQDKGSKLQCQGRNQQSR